MKKALSFFLLLVLLVQCMTFSAFASEEGTDAASPDAVATSGDLNIKAASAVLMEAKTGKILYTQNAELALPPASVTKVMTLLLVAEAIDEGKIAATDMVTVSEYAASMGGSQVFLEAGEQFTVEELIKCTVIASANDAAVALAEFTCGSESAFVTAMNERAASLGLTASVFENVTGLDDTTQNHVMSALDIAIISRHLICHPIVMKYTSTWMDSFRNGAFTLTNTNRLIRFYPGATGLKTGSTAKAKFCLSATAERDGMTLVAVVMGAETRDVRNAETMRLLDFGFANYALFTAEPSSMGEVKVTCGVKDSLACEREGFYAVVKKGETKKVQQNVSLPSSVKAAVQKGDEVGRIAYTLNGQELGSAAIVASETVERITFFELFEKLLYTFLHLA